MTNINIGVKNVEGIKSANMGEIYYCIECKGKGLCGHRRYKYSCRECKGKGICEHGKQKYYCKQCGGKGICEHGRYATPAAAIVTIIILISC